MTPFAARGRGQTRQRRVNLNQKCVWPVCPVPPHKLLLMPTTPPTAFPKEGVKKLLPVASYDVETIACAGVGTARRGQ